MNRLIASVVVHYKNGEKQTLALVETESDYVIAPYFVSEEKGWKGSGDYMLKAYTSTPYALRCFSNAVNAEQHSIFVEKITF